MFFLFNWNMVQPGEFLLGYPPHPPKNKHKKQKVSFFIEAGILTKEGSVVILFRRKQEKEGFVMSLTQFVTM